MKKQRKDNHWTRELPRRTRIVSICQVNRVMKGTLSATTDELLHLHECCSPVSLRCLEYNAYNICIKTDKYKAMTDIQKFNFSPWHYERDHGLVI